MSKQKACKICKTIYEGEECPNCHNKGSTEEFKGKVLIENPESSEIAKKLGVHKPGTYAIKIK